MLFKHRVDLKNPSNNKVNFINAINELIAIPGLDVHKGLAEQEQRGLRVGDIDVNKMILSGLFPKTFEESSNIPKTLNELYDSDLFYGAAI